MPKLMWKHQAEFRSSNYLFTLYQKRRLKEMKQALLFSDIHDARAVWKGSSGLRVRGKETVKAKHFLKTPHRAEKKRMTHRKQKKKKKLTTSNIHVAFQQRHFYLIRRRRSPAFDKQALWQLIGVKAWNSEMSWHRMQRTFSQISVTLSYEVFSSLSLQLLNLKLRATPAALKCPTMKGHLLLPQKDSFTRSLSTTPLYKLT